MRVTEHISLDNFSGRVRLRFLLPQCRKTTLLPFKWTPEGINSAKEQAITIQHDIDTGCFDTTLKRYSSGYLPPQAPTRLPLLWDDWVTAMRVPPSTSSTHHDLVRKMIVSSKARLGDTLWFLESSKHLSPSTFNQRLSYLRSFYSWLVERGITSSNPFLKVSPLKNNPKRVQPFTIPEVVSILTAFRDNTFCSPLSRYKHSHFYPFTYFLFKSGCRTSEAIGLRVKDVDFRVKLVSISSSLVRYSRNCSTGSKRVRKGTKSEYSVRTLPLTPDLEAVLSPLCTSRDPDDLVFTSATGLPIDDHNYRNRYWKPVLEGLGLEYRKPYTTRHTAASLALTQGSTIHEVAAMLGHSDPSLVLSTYGHLLHDIKLPDFLPPQ